MLAGSFTLACAEAVCADERLTPALVSQLLFQLAKKSLIESKANQPAQRYDMLVSVRTYAAELAGDPDAKNTLHRLAAWLLEIVREGGSGGLASVFSMLPDLDNIRIAIEAKLRSERDEDIADAAELVGSYRHLWMSTNRQPELRQLCATALSRLDAKVYVTTAALVATAIAGASTSLYEVDALERAIELNEKVGDFAAVSAHRSRLAWNLAVIGRLEEAVETAERAEETLVHVRRSSRAHHFVRTTTAHVFLQNGDVPRARRTIAELDRIQAQEGTAGELDFVIMRACAVAEIDSAEGKFVEAYTLCEETIAKCAEHLSLDPKWIALRQMQIENALKLGRIDDAAARCKRYIIDRQQTIDYSVGRHLEADVFQDVADIALRRGNVQDAARLLAYSGVMFESYGYAQRRLRRIDAAELWARLRIELEPDDLASLEREGSGMARKDARELTLAILSNDVLPDAIEGSGAGRA